MQVTKEMFRRLSEEIGEVVVEVGLSEEVGLLGEDQSAAQDVVAMMAGRVEEAE